MRKIKEFFENLRRLISWIPVIWSIRDWDYQYSIDVFVYSLKRLAGHIDKYGDGLNKEETVKEIRDAIRYLDVYSGGVPGFEEHISKKAEYYFKEEKRLKDEAWGSIRANIEKWWN